MTRTDERRPAPSAPRRRLGRALLAGVVLLGGLLLIRSLTGEAPWPAPDAAKDFLTLGISVVIESLPFVLLGIALSVIVQVWLPDGLVVRYLPRRPVLRRAVISLFGMFLPVCECGNVPLARGFVVRGFTVPETITFLVAAPILNPVTIITTQQAFGWDNGILVARIAAGFLLANLLGWLFSLHPRPTSLLTERFDAECRVAQSGTDHAHSRQERSVDIVIKESAAMMPALFAGSFLAAAIQVLVPRETLTAVGADPLLSVLAMMVLAFVVAICSNVDAFFALSFAGTFLPGALVAFLVFGPVIDIKMLVLLRTTFSGRTIAVIAVITGLVALAAGMVVNYAG